MRILFFLLTFALWSSAQAQDYCKQIKKEVSPDKKIFDYSSPDDATEVTTIKVSRSINVDPDYEADNFLMIFQITGDLDNIYTKTATEQTEKEEYKLLITFEDKSTIADDTIKIGHDFTNDKLQAIRNVYLPLTDIAIKELSTKKITKFSLAGYEKTITSEYANAVMHFVECIRKAK